MKQKITLEIDNDTGLEFEDTTKWDCPKEGEYFINSRHKIEKSDRFSSCYHFVLTPKVDHELEEAKIRYKLGSYFKTIHSDDILMVKKVFRGLDDGTIFIQAKAGSCKLNDCTPFPLPKWRCCESDKPKRDENYFVRFKEGEDKRIFRFEVAHGWNLESSRIMNLYEWLDEGER